MLLVWCWLWILSCHLSALEGCLKTVDWQDCFHLCFYSCHVIGISDLVDLWVIKIKSLWSFAHVVRRDHVNRARNTDHAARTCERFVLFYGQNNKTVWLSNMADIFLKQIYEVRKGMWAFFSWLCFPGSDWLGRQALITWCAQRNDPSLEANLITVSIM